MLVLREFEKFKDISLGDLAIGLLKEVSHTERFRGIELETGYPFVMFVFDKARDAIWCHQTGRIKAAWLLSEDVEFCHLLMADIGMPLHISEMPKWELCRTWMGLKHQCLRHMRFLRKVEKELQDWDAHIVACRLMYFWKGWIDGVEESGFTDGVGYSGFEFGGSYLDATEDLVSYVEKYIKEGLDKDCADLQEQQRKWFNGIKTS